MKKHILLWIILALSTQSLLAQQFLVEEDLRLNWVFHDQDRDIMLPFLDNSSEKPHAIHLPIHNNYSENSYIKLAIPENTSLFIQNQFIEKHKEASTRLLSVDSLLNVYAGKAINLTLYNKNGFFKPSETKVGFIHQVFKSSINVNPISKRSVDHNIDYLKIIILLIFAFFVILFNLFPSDLFEFLSLSSLVTFRFTETAFLKYRTITKTQSLVIFYEGALISGILVILINYYRSPLEHSFIANLNPILGWMTILAGVLILFFFKYVLISVVSTLFNVSDKSNFYLIEFLRMAMMFYSVVFVVLAFIVINHFYLVEVVLKSLTTIFVIFNILRFIILYFKFRRTVPMKSLHLFSYLCTTELIPIILGVKFFLK